MLQRYALQYACLMPQHPGYINKQHKLKKKKTLILLFFLFNLGKKEKEKVKVKISVILVYVLLAVECGRKHASCASFEMYLCRQTQVLQILSL